MSRVVILDGHPNPDSLTAGIVRAYADGNPAARVIAVRDLAFDPNMRFGYGRHLDLEPDLVEARAAIREATRLVVATPVWWRSVPALLKGFCDRTFLPREDFRYRANGTPEGLLTGRSAHVFITSDTPLWLQPYLRDTRLRSFTHGTLGFCGFGPVTTTRFAVVRNSTPEQRAGWIQRAHEQGRRDHARHADREPHQTPAEHV